jgi:hypothetical protein
MLFKEIENEFRRTYKEIKLMNANRLLINSFPQELDVQYNNKFIRETFKN